MKRSFPLKVRRNPGAPTAAVQRSLRPLPRLPNVATDRTNFPSINEVGIPLDDHLLKDASRTALVIDCQSSGPSPDALGEDESYRLDVSPSQARLTAPTVVGALRGMETFLQLISLNASGFSAPAVHIEDRPRFAWRGLLIDVTSHWMPIPVIKRNLDAMAAVKLNDFEIFPIKTEDAPPVFYVGAISRAAKNPA